MDEYFGVNDLRDIVKNRRRTLPRRTDRGAAPDHAGPLRLPENLGRMQLGMRLLRDPADPRTSRLGADGRAASREAEMLAARGVRELIVIAQDTTYYGLDLYGERRLGECSAGCAASTGSNGLLLRLPGAVPDGRDRRAARRTENVQIYPRHPVSAHQRPATESMRRGLNKRRPTNDRRTAPPDPRIALRTTLLTGYPGESEAISTNCWNLSNGCDSNGSESSRTRKKRAPIRPCGCATTYRTR